VHVNRQDRGLYPMARGLATLAAERAERAERGTEGG